MHVLLCGANDSSSGGASCCNTALALKIIQLSISCWDRGLVDA